MKKKFTNETHIEGYLYDHALEMKVTGDNSKNPGTNYIRGKISIATDDDVTNIVDINFTYEPENNKNGKNAKYATLVDIINGVLPTYLAKGESAARLRVDSAIGLNEFYSDNRTGELELVSRKRNEGGFIHPVNGAFGVADQRSTFKADMLITKVSRFEENSDRGTPERVVIHGAVFDFRKNLLPVEFTVLHPDAMDYFESLGASDSHPVFTQVWGSQVSSVVTSQQTIESAWGEPQVREVKRTYKDYIITGARPEVYDFGDESTITAADLTNMMAARETMLADLKSRALDSKAANAAPASAIPAAATQKFKF